MVLISYFAEFKDLRRHFILNITQESYFKLLKKFSLFALLDLLSCIRRLNV